MMPNSIAMTNTVQCWLESLCIVNSSGVFIKCSLNVFGATSVLLVTASWREIHTCWELSLQLDIEVINVLFISYSSPFRQDNLSKNTFWLLIWSLYQEMCSVHTDSSVDQSGVIVKVVLMAVVSLNSAFICSLSWWMLDSCSCQLIIRSSGNGFGWHLQMQCYHRNGSWCLL